MTQENAGEAGRNRRTARQKLVEAEALVARLKAAVHDEERKMRTRELIIVGDGVMAAVKAGHLPKSAVAEKISQCGIESRDRAFLEARGWILPNASADVPPTPASTVEVEG